MVTTREEIELQVYIRDHWRKFSTLILPCNDGTGDTFSLELPPKLQCGAVLANAIRN